jgi:biopolymer transport protein ExbD
MLEIARSRPRRSHGITLTSLIDVMFLLMKFFVLTTSYINIEALTLAMLQDNARGVASAPMHASTDVAVKGEAQELVLLSSGAAFLNGQLAYFGELEDKLEVILLRKPDTPIIVLSDEGVKVQMMVDVLDMIQRAGGSDVRLARWKKEGAKML